MSTPAVALQWQLGFLSQSQWLTHVVFLTVGGKRILCICENHVKITDLLTYQLQFKAGSDLDEKLSKKTEVIKQVVCDSVNEKHFL